MQFSSAPPYTFSQLRDFLREFQGTEQGEKNTHIKESVFCKTLTGMVVPLVTISDFRKDRVIAYSSKTGALCFLYKEEDQSIAACYSLSVQLFAESAHTSSVHLIRDKRSSIISPTHC